MVAALLTLLLMPTHNASQGKSNFDLDDDGTVRIEIQIGAVDLPELCNVDFSVRDRAKAERDLSGCLMGGLRYWVRIRANDKECPLSYLAWRELEPRTNPPVVAIDAKAECPAAKDIDVLGIDWGLFTGSILDHTNVAKIELPTQDPVLFAFSKRARKLDIPLRHPLPPVVLGAVGLLALSAAVGGIIVGRRRARAKGRG